MMSNIGCAGTGHERLEQRLERLVDEQGQRAVVIGQSRGGSMAKVLAVRRPDLVCGLVTLGSPHVEPLAVHPLVRAGVEAVSRLGSLGVPGLFKRGCLDGECCATFWDDLAGPTAAGVGFVAVYSRSDGIVDWRACLDPAADEQVEIASSHCGMAVSPAAWRAVAAALERFGRAEARRKAAAKTRKPGRKLRRVA
jgi:pimeloyl-ACP methyl ester carboxylesterase